MRKGWIVVALLAFTAYAEPESKSKKVWEGGGHLVVYDLYPVAQQALRSEWWAKKIERSILGSAARSRGTDLSGKALLGQLEPISLYIPKRMELRMARDSVANLIRFGHVMNIFNLMATETETEEEEREFHRARDEFRDLLDKMSTARIHAVLEMREKQVATTVMMLARLATQQVAMEFESPLKTVPNGFAFDFDIGSMLVENWMPALADEKRPGLKAALKKFRLSFRLVLRGTKLVLDVGPLDDLIAPPPLTLVRGNRIAVWNADMTPARAALQDFRQSDKRWAETKIGRKLAAGEPPVAPEDDVTETELDEVEALLTRGSGSIETEPYGVVTRIAWSEKGRVPPIGTLTAARYLSHGALFTWTVSESMPRLARRIYTSISERLWLRTVMRGSAEIYREFLARFGKAGEALAKLEGFAPGAVMLVDLKRTKVRINGVDRSLPFPVFCFVGTMADRQVAEKAIRKVGSMLSGSTPTNVMRRGLRLRLGPDAYRIEFGSKDLRESVKDFVPHVVFYGDTVMIGTSVDWTRALRDAAVREKEPRLPWAAEIFPVEYIRFSGDVLARHSHAVSDWAAVADGRPMDPALGLAVSHMCTLFDSAEYWALAKGDSREAVYRLRFKR